MKDDYRDLALNYHQYPSPGKLRIEATTPLTTQIDLALAYSPGVAFPCEEIVKNELAVNDYTARGNLVGVITNGTAVLGLGNIGSLASKPVMEGKAVLFKKFANIDVFDIEVNESDPLILAETIARLEPTFGGINLEDIKAPDCFIVEKYLRERLSIPVFHDDQHGTAIVVAAAMMSALEITGKSIEQIKLVTSGAGAAALSCLKLLVSLGLKHKNIIVTDLDGVVYRGRTEGMDEYKKRYEVDTKFRTLGEAISGADVLLGLSAGNVVSADMVKSMAKDPIVFALANPHPEILPDLAKSVRDDLIIATGRSDFPNQVNNVLCFPFLFRGALDVSATEINEEMKVACVKAISSLARAGTSDVVSSAYSGESLIFGAEYLIPKPFDPRLIISIAPAVAKAAMDSGVARRPIKNFEAYREKLTNFVYQSGLFMKPLFDNARENQRRVVFAEGENLRVLQAVDNIVQEKLCIPVVLGREQRVSSIINQNGLSLKIGTDVEVIDFQEDDRLWQLYHHLMKRNGITPGEAKDLCRTSTTIQAALMVKMGLADCMICGTIGRFHSHLGRVLHVAEQIDDMYEVSTLTAHILRQGTIFICDTQVTPDPDAKQIANMTIQAAREVRRFGIEPKVALLSHSNFGNRRTASSKKMRQALSIIQQQEPELQVDGEMHADTALSERIREKNFPGSSLKGMANLLVMPNLDAANITYNALKMLGGGVHIGPILIGCNMAVHIATSSVTVRGLVNLTAIAAAKCEGQSV